MTLSHETIEEQGAPSSATGRVVPGLVGIFSCTSALFLPLSLERGPIELGRTTHDALLDDDRLSRRHVRVDFEGGQFVVTDLGSRNGTYVDGTLLQGATRFSAPRLLRIGRSLLLFVSDVRPYQQGTVTTRGDMIVGPRLAHALARITRSAALGSTLLVTGESGSGKELAARQFHAATPRASGPFVAVNCATIPAGVAERLLFGTRKGAFSGATSDAEGYAQAAHGGTLFLDELAELEIGVQPKLLRLLEEGEILPLGATRPVKVDIRVVGATLRNLRAEAARGRFREDLYYRMGNPEVRLPPLRERLEELPWLIRALLTRSHAELEPHPLLIETCALRAWPGNVRELAHELRQAAENAIAAGRTQVSASDLEASAGLALAEERETTQPQATKPTDEQIAEMLRRENGNVSGAARALGMHRTQLRRWIARRGGDPHAAAPSGSPLDDRTDEEELP